MTQPADYTYPRHLIRPTRWLILTYMREFYRSHQRQPKIKEIACAFGIPTQHVYVHLRGTTQLVSLKVNRKECVS